MDFLTLLMGLELKYLVESINKTMTGFTYQSDASHLLPLTNCVQMI